MEMDILRCLTQDGASLLPEDLDMLAEEVACGGYPPEYRKRCEQLIKELRSWLKSEASDETSAQGAAASDPGAAGATASPKQAGGIPKSLAVDPAVLSPYNRLVQKDLSPKEIVERDLDVMRRSEGYKALFRLYLGEKNFLDADFFDRNATMFSAWETSLICEALELPEETLERYFATLDHRKIARYQLFSEGFFMRHYQDLDAKTVLVQGRNPWRDKTQRSKQLDVFLRLKGVAY